MMEIARFVVRYRGAACFAGRIVLLPGTEMEFADFDFVRLKFANRCGGIFKLNREMARVVIHAQMPVEPVVFRPVFSQILKERNRFGRSL